MANLTLIGRIHFTQSLACLSFLRLNSNSMAREMSEVRLAWSPLPKLFFGHRAASSRCLSRPSCRRSVVPPQSLKHLHVENHSLRTTASTCSRASMAGQWSDCAWRRNSSHCRCCISTGPFQTSRFHSPSVIPDRK